MASDGKLFRIEKKVKVKIGEAKNLVRSYGSIIQKDIYCIMCLDQEEIFRTGTVEKITHPFFGDEFQFDIPREFRYLSLYLYERERPIKADKPLGKVSIRKPDLKSFQGKDQWFPILPVDANSEVQGQVRVQVKFKIRQQINDHFQQTVEVSILECINLSVVSGCCNPVATVTLIHANNKTDSRKTKSKKETTSPTFNEVFIFENPYQKGTTDKENEYSLEDAAGFQEIRVALWHESSGMFGNIFLGEVKISLSSIASVEHIDAWYLLQPKESQPKYSLKSKLGALRINIYYTEDTVFNSNYYDQFRNAILDINNDQPMTTSVSWLLGEIVFNKVEISLPLTRLFYHYGKIVPFISRLCRLEFANASDTNTMFRGNTLGSKCIDDLMKLVGISYLRDTLKSIVDVILRDKKPCEIDDVRLLASESKEQNMNTLVNYVKQIVEAISRSALSCPPVMCQIFSELRELANIYFPHKPELRYSVISSFVFLRFFAPSILGPKLFDLTNEQIDAPMHRSLTLVSKCVQNISNRACFRNDRHYAFKESYMKEVYERCSNNQSSNLVEGVRTYLEIISQIPNGNLKSAEISVVLKEGTMVKRAQGRKKFGLKNFKSRFFRLTTRDFSYSKKRDSHALCIIPVENILAVEKVEESSFKLKNMFQIVQHTRTLYMQAPNCVEEKEWLDLLTKVLQFNAYRLKQYHPGAFINSYYQCCHANSENAAGCSAVSNYIDCDVKIQIDHDRETERIYSLASNNRQKMDDINKHLADMNGSNEIVMLGDVPIDDPYSTLCNLKLLTENVSQLEAKHKVHDKQMQEQTKYGSKHAPIGDEKTLTNIVVSEKLKNKSLKKTPSFFRSKK